MSNQILDPKQSLALSYYRDPKSETFGNKTQSLIRAGYTPRYASTVMGRVKWISENVERDVALVQGAENNLREVVDKKMKFNKENVELYKLKLDASKFIIKNTKYKDTEDKAQTAVQVNIVKYNNGEVDISTNTLHNADPIK